MITVDVICCMTTDIIKTFSMSLLKSLRPVEELLKVEKVGGSVTKLQNLISLIALKDRWRFRSGDFLYYYLELGPLSSPPRVADR